MALEKITYNKLIPITKYLLVGFLSIVLIYISPAKAQSQWGVQAGTQLSNVRYYHGNSYSRIGITMGLFFQTPIDAYQDYAFLVELRYSQQGERNAEYDTKKYYIDYIAMPIMLKRYFRTRYIWNVEIGPEVSYKINQRTSENALFKDEKDYVKGYDISIGIGAGISLNERIELGIRGNYGFVDIYPKAIGESTGKINNSTKAQLCLRYFF